ncbi:MAG: hypothetical protein AAF226_18530, partial [Verrucomicrobiota bacterium]
SASDFHTYWTTAGQDELFHFYADRRKLQDKWPDPDQIVEAKPEVAILKRVLMPTALAVPASLN